MPFGHLQKKIKREDVLREEDEKEFHTAEQKSVEKGTQTSSFPVNWELTLQLVSDDKGEEVAIKIVAIWRKFKARVEATLLNGSYSILDNSFKGSFRGPWIDTQSTHPGNDWIEIDDPDFVLPRNNVIAVLYSGDIKNALKKLGAQPLGLHQE